MLRIEDITYAIAGRRLFEEARATIPAGHKVGVVGRNGTGKTTLFRLIRRELTKPRFTERRPGILLYTVSQKSLRI